MQKKHYFEFNQDKNVVLFKERGITFEQVIALIEQDHVLDSIDHPNQIKYPNQKMYIVDIDGYCYVVPHIIQEDKIFLKTVIPSKKATKKYLGPVHF
ncbi:MAG TPA: toxin [Rickettsia endosymbiont of Pyrocoelia pectoralis]|nr:toxin [Rickettsia endosymbiont of Pyrocoelia pectoralis]